MIYQKKRLVRKSCCKIEEKKNNTKDYTSPSSLIKKNQSVENDAKKYSKSNLYYDTRYNFIKFLNKIHDFKGPSFKTIYDRSNCFIMHFLILKI